MVTTAMRTAEFFVLQLALPGEPVRNIGVILFDSDRVVLRLRDRWDDIAEPNDAEYLEALEQDLVSRAEEMGSLEFVVWLEDTLSNTLRLTARESVTLNHFEKRLDLLYAKHVESGREIPLAEFRAAAGGFSREQGFGTAGEITLPLWIRATGDLFAGVIEGHSMEPQIPDGSLCLFRAGVAGSRKGKLVLVQDTGTSDVSARFTIKRYTSRTKQYETGEWEHEEIRLEPLNPDYPAFDLTAEPDRYRIIGEFVQVLD